MSPGTMRRRRLEEVRVRVFYPRTEGTIVLRSSLDWERDVEPRHAVAEPGPGGEPGAGVRLEFVLATRDPYLYVKPVLRRGGEMRWAEGDNTLAIAGETRDIWPHFHPDDEAHETNRIVIGTGDDAHTVRVFLPHGYRENTLRRHAVLYMQDGQNQFLPDDAFAGEHWRLGDAVRTLHKMNALEPMLAVGVYPREREVEYTKPGWKAYARFLVGTLKPVIDAGFRTRSGPAATAVMGSSLGGIVAFYLAWEHPDVFGQAACLSSGFGWRDDLRERVLAEEPRRALRFYLDSGWPGDNYEATRAMRDALVRRGFAPGSGVQHLTFPHAEHGERAWAARCHVPLQFLFAPRLPPLPRPEAAPPPPPGPAAASRTSRAGAKARGGSRAGAKAAAGKRSR